MSTQAQAAYSWAKPNVLVKGSPLYLLCILGTVLFITFLSVFATVTTIIAEDAIRGDLALDARATSWLTTINLLGINTIVPSASWFADRFGYKTIFFFGMTLFTLASAVAGFAENFPVLCTARLLEGLGSGFIFPVGLSLLSQNLTEKQLPLALILYITAAFGAGFTIGFPLAGYLTQFVDWHWIFLVIIPGALLCMFICAWVQEDTPDQTIAPFDILGFIFFALFIGSLLVALTYGPMDSTDDGWFSPFILSCFAIALVSITATIYVESRHKNPLLPLVLFHNPIYAVTCAAMFLLGMSIFASAGTMMQYMIEALQYEKFVCGKIGMVYGLPLAFCSILASVLMKKIPVPAVIFLGLGLLIYSYFLNNILNWQTGPDQILFILFLRGVGLGLSLGPATVQALEAVPLEMRNKAATILTFFRQVGGTYGSTVIAIIVIKRTIFHTARFGEQSQSELPGFQVTYQKLYSHYHSTFFDSGTESAALAKATIIQNIKMQAYIQAINDAMIVFGYTTLSVALILVGLGIYEHLKKNRKETSKDTHLLP